MGTGLGFILEKFFFTLMDFFTLSPQQQVAFQDWYVENMKLSDRGIPYACMLNCYAKIVEITGKPVTPVDLDRLHCKWGEACLSHGIDIYIWMGAEYSQIVVWHCGFDFLIPMCQYANTANYR